jgi:prepilin-type N-terminal cleavage/methylation domain-containing protein
MEIVSSFLKLPMACKCQAGFTLNEILVAMNVIVIAVLGYSLNTVGVIQGNMANDNMTIAINLAQDKMEQLKAQKNMINDDRCPGSGDHAITAIGAANGIFNRCWKIADSLLGPHLKQIDVTVSWRDRESREIIVSTLVYADEN